MTLYLLYHGAETGSPEDCSIFYAVPEIFSSLELREKRVAEIKFIQDRSDQEDCYIHCMDVQLDDKAPLNELEEEYCVENDDEYDEEEFQELVH